MVLARRVAPLLALEVAAVVGLLRLGDVPGFAPSDGAATWLRTAPVEELLATAARLLALATALWVLGTTLACLAARGCTRAPALARALRAVALPGIRRLVDRTVAAGWLAGSAVLAVPGPVGAAEPPPVVRAAGAVEVAGPPVVRAPEPTPVVRGAEAPPAGVPEDGGGPAAPAPTSAPARPPAAATGPARPVPDLPPPPEARAARAPVPGSSHRIRPGEHLWGVAEQAVRGVEPEAGTARVARYWGDVVRANRATVASGDPDLVFPGEVLTLPPLPP